MYKIKSKQILVGEWGQSYSNYIVMHNNKNNIKIITDSDLLIGIVSCSLFCFRMYSSTSVQFVLKKLKSLRTPLDVTDICIRTLVVASESDIPLVLLIHILFIYYIV